MNQSVGLATFINSDQSYFDQMYRQYQSDPSQLESSWFYFFQGIEFSRDAKNGASEEAASEGVARKGHLDVNVNKEFNVLRIIQSYRSRGHLLTDTNPIRPRKDRHAHISLERYDLTEEDLQETFHAGHFVGLGKAPLSEILRHCKEVYCDHIGLEFMHINNTEIRYWIREKFEKEAKTINFNIDKKKRILQKLNEAVVFENFLGQKFVGQKRFSLEGGENAIPALDAAINKFSELGGKELVFGMAHRGRLNVLANIIGKTYEFIFHEFEGDIYKDLPGDGDVKYHMGYTSVAKSTTGKEIYLKLMPNPSHLEAVGPVVEGYCRAQVDLGNNRDSSEVLPVVIHGDAAVAGQGVIYETLQMSELAAYQTGGTLHFVINNQIGFTTDFEDARSSDYCTSVARTLGIPILHVNGDDAEAVCFAMEFAIEFRQRFRRDVFVDMVCYRKHGHNEGDEPKYTQPHLYGLISKQENSRDIYVKKLAAGKSLEADLVKAMQEEFNSLLSARFNNLREVGLPKVPKGPHAEWKNLSWSRPGDFEISPETGVNKKTLEHILEVVSSHPESFTPLKKAKKILEDRRKKFEANQLDWALCEVFAFGSLLLEGKRVRFSGQDCQRGTFSHRHAVLFDLKTNAKYINLNHLSEDQGEFSIYNSHLSEYAVLGFEFGYSMASPLSLNIWEAQFGDFANGAQIIIDQFISASESKWRKMSSVVLLLPHGYEGQGPEHSSARVERFLQLSAEDNMVIVNATHPANLFHALRRQLSWDFRKPLVVFTPKSLLRDPRCVSKIEDISSGNFKEIIDDEYSKKEKVKRVLFCSGKIFYDLKEEQLKNERKDVAIIRLEQLYPLAERQLEEILSTYEGSELYWVQEEPKNMGAWTFLLRYPQFYNFRLISRKSSASPASGFSSVHQREQNSLVNAAFS